MIAACYKANVVLSVTTPLTTGAIVINDLALCIGCEIQPTTPYKVGLTFGLRSR